jgi:hypothetical protein
MPEVCCMGGTREDGVKICTRHLQPLIGKAEAHAKGLAEGTFGNAEWFCPITGSGLGPFEADALHDELAEG